MRSVLYNQQINKLTPHFTFMHWAQNADTHALKQHRLSQNISPVCSSFVLVIASDMHLRSQSGKTSEKRWFTHSWKYADTTNTFSLFLDEFLETDLRPFYCSLTTDLFTVVWHRPIYCSLTTCEPESCRKGRERGGILSVTPNTSYRVTSSCQS